MKQKLSKGKRPTKRRTAAASRKTGGKRAAQREDNAQVALAALMALLHADRWLFEAGELAKKAGLDGEIEAFDRIRLSIVDSLNRLQPRAYGALTRGGYLQTGGV